MTEYRSFDDDVMKELFEQIAQGGSFWYFLQSTGRLPGTARPVSEQDR